MPPIGIGVNRTSSTRIYNKGMATNPDVVVIGGGVIGLTSAYLLAKAGLSVEVIERGDLGREASWAGAGIIPPGMHPDLTTTSVDRLRAFSVSRFRDLSDELRTRTGIDNEYHPCPAVEFLTKSEIDLADLWSIERIPFHRLNPQQLEAHIRGVHGVSGYVPFCMMMAQVRNPRHLSALAAGCRDAGVTLTTHVPFLRWERVRQRVVAHTGTGDHRAAGHYLIAAGAWADELLNPLGVRLGVRPVRGQIVLFHPGRRVLEHILIVGKRYLVPRLDGRVLVGSTEEPEAGFEKTNTPAEIDELVQFARQLVPALRDASVEKMWSGLRPGSPDGIPFIGPVPGCENVYAAVGHFRAGIQLSIGTAELVRDMIQNNPTAIPLRPYRLDRVPDATARPAFRS